MTTRQRHLAGSVATKTLYLAGPTHQQARLAAVFGGLLGDLVNQAFDRANCTGQPLPDLLLVMDLCRLGDYADLVVGGGADVEMSAGFLGLLWAAASA